MINEHHIRSDAECVIAYTLDCMLEFWPRKIWHIAKSRVDLDVPIHDNYYIHEHTCKVKEELKKAVNDAFEGVNWREENKDVA